MSDGHWQLEGSAAELYQRYLVPAITTKWAEDLIDRAQLRSGEAVLDIACGTGVVARLAAKRVSGGKVTGLDLNPGMLAVARGVQSEGAPITWVDGSALDLPSPPDSLTQFLSVGVAVLPTSTKPFRRCAVLLKLRSRRAKRLQLD
jgi:ubiquinone/menaquinone biosynthesis C-methylase UbiE